MEHKPQWLEWAVKKTTAEQIRMCFDAYHADNWTTLLD